MHLEPLVNDRLQVSLQVVFFAAFCDQSAELAGAINEELLVSLVKHLEVSL